MTNFRLLTVAGGLAYVAVGISSPFMTLYLQSLGASYIQISLVLVSFVLTLLAFSQIWGWLSDRMGRRKLFVVGGLLGLAAAYAWLSAAPTLATAWSTRIVEGVAMAAYTTLSVAMIGDALAADQHATRHQGRQMGLYRGIGSLAFAAGSVVGGRLADQISLAAVFWVCATAYLAAAAVAVLVREPLAQPGEVTVPATTVSAPAEQTRTQLLPTAFLAGVLLWVAAHSASASMWPNYMTSLGYTNSSVGALWGLAALVELPAMVGLGALSDLVGRTTMLITGGAAIALVNLGYATLAGLIGALVVIQIVRGVGYAAYTGSALTLTTEWGGRARGGASGLFHTASGAGQLAGLLIGGSLVQFAGFATLFLACAVLALGSAGCFWLLHYQTRRAAHSARLAMSRTP
jgi:MFS family permease